MPRRPDMGKERTGLDCKWYSDSNSSIINTGDGNTATRDTIATNAPSEAESSNAPISRQQHFRLLDLPLELQRLVFYHYFGGPYDITLDNERLTMLRSRFHVLGVPPLDLLLTSQHICTHAAPIRHSLFTGRLVLNSVFILVPLRRQERFQWLRDNTRILHFSDSSVHPERWGRYFGVLQGLRRLEIVFPSVIKLGTTNRLSAFDDWGAEDVMDGRGEVDEWLIGSLDKFRLTLVDQLREGMLEVVVTQRYDLKRGTGEEEIVVSRFSFCHHGSDGC